MNNQTEIFQKLWDDYILQNPTVKDVYDLFISKGEEVINDHIAFRTFNDERINIEVMSRLFLDMGFKQMGEYNFEEKHLKAKHFESDSDKIPRIFISELKLEEMSPFVQQAAKSMVDKIPDKVLNDPTIFLSGRTWGKPSFSTYEKLREESEYAAWVYVYGFRANHFTVSINELKEYNTIQKVNSLLKNNGFEMNTVGGEIKGSPEVLLEQSSIIAGKLPIDFSEGVHEIPSCFYEFANRYKDKDGNLFSGFIAKNANKIFESTNYYKG